jgi:hypothetical protein
MMSDKYEKARERLRKEVEKAKAARKPYSRGIHPRVAALKAAKE